MEALGDCMRMENVAKSAWNGGIGETYVVGHVGVHNDDEIARGELDAVNVGCTESELAGSGLQELYHGETRAIFALVLEDRAA